MIGPFICTQRNIFEILLNETEIRLYLPFSDRFVTKRTSVWIQINHKMINTIWFRVDSIRFRKYFSVCIHEQKYIYETRQIQPNLDYNYTFKFGTRWNSVWCQINRKSFITILICFNLTWHRNLFLYIYI